MKYQIYLGSIPNIVSIEADSFNVTDLGIMFYRGKTLIAVFPLGSSVVGEGNSALDK